MQQDNRTKVNVVEILGLWSPLPHIWIHHEHKQIRRIHNISACEIRY